jgi:hypothetical protein
MEKISLQCILLNFYESKNKQINMALIFATLFHVTPYGIAHAVAIVWLYCLRSRDIWSMIGCKTI